MSELAFLFASFPHLGDAFDADGLPLPFIIKRDARDARVKSSRPHRSIQITVGTRGTHHLNNGRTARRRGD